MRVLKIKSLPDSRVWVDKDIVMLHACFQILKNYVDKEKPFTVLDNEYHREHLDEIKALYDWWKKRKGVWGETKEDDAMLTRLMNIRTSLWV